MAILVVKMTFDVTILGRGADQVNMFNNKDQEGRGWKMWRMNILRIGLTCILGNLHSFECW